MAEFEEPMEETPAPAIAPPAETPEIKLFARWSCDDVQVSDISLHVSSQEFRY